MASAIAMAGAAEGKEPAAAEALVKEEMAEPGRSPATTSSTAAAEKEEERRKMVMVIGVDSSDHSYHMLEWTLRRFFCATPGGPEAALYELVIVHAKPHPASVVSIAGPGVADVIPYVDADLRKLASIIVEKCRAMCAAKSVNAVAEVIEGDARNVLCEAVEKHHADILVVGSHGYGPIKRAFLGSVSDYCAHHAQCTVMIVKKPKDKH